MKSGFDERLEKIRKQVSFLPDKPEETAESTLRALWLTAFGRPMSAESALTEDLPDLDADKLSLLDGLIEERIAGKPLAHVTGRQKFFGLEMRVSPAALLPRKETEILARAATSVIAEIIESRGDALMVDTCCGSGNVTLAVAYRAPSLRAIGIDLSPEAVDLARLNARSLSLDHRVEFQTGDLFGPAVAHAGEVDLITCNPPYISSTKVKEMADEIVHHEPEMAFDGGPFGIRILNRLIKEAPPLLSPRGYLAFEVGLGQGEPIVARLKKSGAFATYETVSDDSGAVRAVVARLA